MFKLRNLLSLDCPAILATNFSKTSSKNTVPSSNISARITEISKAVTKNYAVVLPKYEVRLANFATDVENFEVSDENYEMARENCEVDDENYEMARENCEVGVGIMGIVVNLELTVARTSESGIRDVGTC